jgi:gliding motility-associated-like protein
LNDPQYCNNGEVYEFDVYIFDNILPTLEPSQVCLDALTGTKNVEFKAGGAAEIKYTFPGSITANGIKANWQFTSPGTYQITIEAADPKACNSNVTKVFPITVSPTPKSNFSFTTPEENTPVVFTNLTNPLEPSNNNFLWDFRDGETSDEVNPDHIFNFTKRYEVKLLVTNKNSGCKDSTTKSIFAKISSLVNIPTAFTPLNATNNTFGVIGYGIKTVDMKIYNRWGVKVFDSETSRFRNWDGTFNGLLQPMDVYTYIAQVSFTDGDSQTLKGDVTLIR